MIKELTLLTFATSAFLCGCTSLANSAQSPITPENTMSGTNNIIIKSLTLMAREEKLPPLGQPPKPNRDIGFADVFLTLENPKEANATLVIEKIQIQDVTSSSLQLVSQKPQVISLGPLENSVNDFHLTNKIGYTTRGQVKAIVTYRINDQVQVIQSSPVDIKGL
ncbi:MAG: hypothetical protein KME64_00205 [Scytonematopsis contorta HA4267-MV1]|jgi:hypothetical protein|nr:hypothetical protein [Scytonematopsis contorta HA4267-MV1]